MATQVLRIPAPDLPVAVLSKPQPAPAPVVTAKPIPTAGPSDLLIKLGLAQATSGNLAIQRAAEADIPILALLTGIAAANAQEDPAHQSVASNMGTKAKVQKTPIKTPEEKQQETVLAAKAATKKIIDT